MKRSKKTIGALLIVVMLFSAIVTGCGSGKSAADQSKKQTTITVWVHPFVTDPDASKKMWDGYAEEFEHQNPNIKVNIQNIPWANRDQRMLTAFSAGKGPDVVYLIPDHLSQFGTMGIVEPLDNLISDDVKNDYYPNALKAATIGGKLYGLPMLETAEGWFYNLDLLKQAGWNTNKLPETWDEFLAMCKMVKDKTGKFGTTMELGGTANMTYYPYLWQAGGDILDKDGKTVIDSEATRRSMEFLKTIYQNGYAPQDSITTSDGSAHKGLIKDGQVACVFSDTFIVDAKDYKFDWALGPVLKDKNQATYGTIGSWSISHNSPNKEAAAKWITFLTSPEQMEPFLKATKYFPPRKALKDMYKDDAVMNKLAGQVQYVSVGVVHPAGRPILSLVSPELQGVVMGKETPDQAVNKLVPAINKAVKDSLALKP